MSARKTSKKSIRMLTQPIRVTHKGARPSLGSTLGAISAERSESSPGRMTPGGDQPAGREEQLTTRPSAATGEEAPRERPSATGGPPRGRVAVRRRR